MVQATVAVGVSGQAKVHAVYADDNSLGLGEGTPAQIVWDTSDANANMLKLELPAGGSVDVPVILAGIGHRGEDLTFFNGVTQPTLGVVDADRDSWLVMDFSGDDAARIRSNRATNITTSAGALTLTPNTDTLLADGTGLVVGHTGQLTVSDGGGSTDLIPEVQIIGTGQADSTALLAAFSTTATRAAAPTLAFAKGGASSVAVGTVVTDDEILGSIIAYGDDGTDIEAPAAAIEFAVDGGPGTGDMPGRIVMYTTADGSETLVEHMRIGTGGIVTISDDGTGNAGMTRGITLFQSSNDNEIFAGKSSDVNHGRTGLAEADTFFSFRKWDGATGGLEIRGLGDDHANLQTTLLLYGSGGTPQTSHATGSIGLASIQVEEHDGANNAANITTHGNVFTVRGQVGGSMLTRFLIDAEGDIFCVNVTTSGDSVAATAFDSENDPELIRAFELARAPESTIKTQWDEFVTYREQDLVDMGILGATLEEGGLWNLSQHTRLLNGAVWQLYTQLKDMGEKLALTESKLSALEAA